MKINIFINIIKNIFKKYYFLNIIKKIFKRFENDYSKEATKWAKLNVKYNTDLFLKSIDHDLYIETISEIKKLENECNRKLSSLDVKLGGGGNYLLLYFQQKAY